MAARAQIVTAAESSLRAKTDISSYSNSGLISLRRQRAWLATAALSGPMRGLALMGRWSLSYYLLHQPGMRGGLMLWLWLRG